MALSTASARSRVKDFADIPSATTDFDSDIDNYVLDAVNLLYPIAMAELGPDYTTLTFAAEERSGALPGGYEQVRSLELYDSSIGDFVPTRDFKTHNGKIWLDRAVSEATLARIFGWGRYALATVPAELELVVLYWALSGLYSSLAGNKRKYNVYIASAGAAADRDMKDSSDYYNDLANQILADRAKLAGA